MCELFAMSSRLPADVQLSLEAFSRRGGLAGPHKDGWGVAYYAGQDVRLVKEAEPGSDSACVRFMLEHPFRTSLALSHIRKATRGATAMKNCQPFQRELGGRMHVFAHNGDLDLATLRARTRLHNFRPVGDTDSEYAFCALLEQLRASWLEEAPPCIGERRRIVERFAGEIRALGPANFIYSDGEALFIHGHKRFHGDGRPPRAPGLHVLCRRCAGTSAMLATDGLRIDLPAQQELVLAASVPLTDEPGWRALAQGELLMAQAGCIMGAAPPAAQAPREPTLAA
jgi:predicted glutamine amidotransferase